MEEESLIPASELCVHHNIEMSFIYSLQEYGLIEMITREETIFIPSEHLSELEKLIRMHYELNINLEGIDVICHLLKRIEASQQEINHLKGMLRLYQPNE